MMNEYEMNENGLYTNAPSRASTEAIERLQEKRDEVAKAMRLVIIGAPCLLIPPLGILLLLIGYVRLTKAQKDMESLYKDAFVREPLANHFDNVVYEPAMGFSKEAVQSFQLCEMGNRFYTEDYIRASYCGVGFEVAQVKVVYADNSGDHNYSKTYFDGRMMVFNFPDKLVNSVLLFSNKYKNRGDKYKESKKMKVELEGVQFNKDFDVYAPVPHDAFYLLTPHMMERLQFLDGKYESLAMNVVGNRVMLAFNEPGRNAFDSNVSIGKVDIDAEMAKVQGEIDDIRNFISLILNLN